MPVPLSLLTRKPAFERKTTPEYPEAERALGREVTVLAEATIDPSGTVADARIVRGGGSRFDEAALAALRASRFRPGYLGDQPVAVRVQVPFQFRLR